MKPGLKHSFFFLLLALSTPGLASELQNRLAGNPSPYLAMHGEDPTAWQIWSRETVELARKQNKLLFVSVGYFSCHWCHVMQRESYRNAEIASYINQHYIPVKVDRETEAALDAYLIAFAERTQGYSGWPLNVFMTPEGYPLFATVYQPPEKFLQLLKKMQALWTQSPGELKRLASEALPHGDGPGKPIRQTKLAAELSAQVEQLALQIGSPLTGGFGEANKFPLAPQVNFLLDRISANENKDLKDFIELTLNNMARYGLRDHLGGGFFRYTVDPGWRTPHFEKMLYDNAQLAEIYMHAATIYHSDMFRQIARETLDFMQSQMVDDRGALIASFSAIDSNNVEGGNYLWHKKDIIKLLTAEEWKVYRVYAGLNDPSPLDDGYLPMEMHTAKEVAAQLQLPQQTVQTLVQSSERKLYKERQKRTPIRDTKLLAGWNGLALSAFCHGAREFDSDTYRQVASRIRRYLKTRLWDGQRLLRAVDNGEPLGQASLEDYAYVSRGLLDWASLNKTKEDYRLARSVVRQAWDRFYGKQGWRLSGRGFIPMESPVDVLQDGPTPSPSATVIAVSLELAKALNDDELRRQALSAANSGQQLMRSDPFWYVSEIRVLGTQPR
jgi:uncharacterized protein YyaL (SSP411 family)